MKAITDKQPWASLIVEGIKDVENRTWPCPKKYIGKRVLIHAGMIRINHIIRNVLNDAQYAEFRKKYKYSGLDFLEPMGAIIGSVEIVDCVINHPSIWAEKSETNCSEKCRSKNCEHFIEWGFFRGDSECRSCKLIGQSYEIEEVPKDCPHGVKINTIYNWVLANPIKFPEPIPAKGKLGFWEYPNISAEPEEKDGELFCHCSISVKLENQVMTLMEEHRCRYCGGKWYR